MSKGSGIKWLSEPERQDYLAAASYLSLIYPPKKARSLADKLKRAGRSDFHAKDIFRASGLALLPAENFHVNKDRRKISSGRQLSPLLLIRDPSKSKVIVAD